MKEYTKPFIEDEDIELEDVIASSDGGSTENGVEEQFPWN